MSQKRVIELKIDYELMAEVAKKNGLNVRRDDFIYGYSTRNIKAPLVVDIGTMSIGFKDNQMIYDDMINMNKATNLIESYVTEKLLRGGLMVEKVIDNNREVVLRVRR